MSAKETTEKKKTRSFKVKLDQDTPAYGRYNGDSPYQAANKALSEMVRADIKEGGDPHREHVFWIIESTKGSKRSHHQYRGYREDLEVPVEYVVGDNTIVKRHKNVLKKIKKADQDELVVKVTRKAAAKKTTKKAVKKTTKTTAKKTTKAVAAKKTTKTVAKKTTKAVAAKKTTKAVAKTTPKTTKKTTKVVAAKKTTKAVAKTAKKTVKK